MKRVILACLIFVSVGFGQSALSAALRAYRCDSCSTPAQFNSRALQGPMFGNRYVYNLDTGIIKKFFLQPDQGGGVPRGNNGSGNDLAAPPIVWVASEVAVESQVTSFLSDLSRIYGDLGNSLHYQGTIDLGSVLAEAGAAVLMGNPELTGGHDQVYNFVSNGQFRNIVTDHVRADVLANPDIATLGRVSATGGVNLAVVELDFGLQQQTSVSIQATWPDGSFVVFEYNRDTGRLEYVDGSARDSQQNTVPDNSHQQPGGNPGDLIGMWRPTDVNRWLDAAAMRGIPVTRGNGSRIQCGRVNGGVIQCTVVFQ